MERRWRVASKEWTESCVCRFEVEGAVDEGYGVEGK